MLFEKKRKRHEEAPVVVVDGRVTVFYWSDWGYMLGQPGHIALRTYTGGPDGTGIYASFWPEDGDKAVFKKGTTRRFHTYEQDLAEEKRRPETIDLYTLNVEAIYNAFKKFRDSNANWSIFGSSLLISTDKKNCAGLTFALLEAGGAQQLIDGKRQRETYARIQEEKEEARKKAAEEGDEEDTFIRRIFSDVGSSISASITTVVFSWLDHLPGLSPGHLYRIVQECQEEEAYIRRPPSPGCTIS